MDLIPQFSEQINVWRTDPVAFAYEALRVDYLTNQQEELLRALGDFVYANAYQALSEEAEAIKKSKYAHTRESRLNTIFDELWSMELTDYHKSLIRKKGFMISSGRSLGKSAFIAITVWWFLTCFDKPQGYLIAPTGQQAKSVLMSEIDFFGKRKIEVDNPQDPTSPIYETAFIFSECFETTSEKISYKAAPLQRFMEVKRISTNQSVEDQKAQLSGFHSPDQLFILDEAIAFDPCHFETINATNASPLNWLIGTFNPIDPTAYAVDAVHGGKAALYVTRIWSAEESDMPGIENTVADAAIEYGGTDNDLYRVNVQGLPPVEGDDTFIPLSWIAQARRRVSMFPDAQTVIIGHDVAGEGSDDTFTWVRRGYEFIAAFTHSGASYNEQAAFLYDLYEEYSPDEINIDTIGIGEAVCSLLRQRCHVARGVKVSRKPFGRNGEKFYNQRAQFYWRVREAFKNGWVSFSPNISEKIFTRLQRELARTSYSVSEKQQIKIAPKDKIKELLGGRSPDAADALMLTFSGMTHESFADGSLTQSNKRHNDLYETMFRKSKEKKPGLGWMSV